MGVLKLFSVSVDFCLDIDIHTLEEQTTSSRLDLFNKLDIDRERVAIVVNDQRVNPTGSAASLWCYYLRSHAIIITTTTTKSILYSLNNN